MSFYFSSVIAFIESIVDTDQQVSDQSGLSE